MAKIQGAELERMAEAIRPLDTRDLRDRYRAGEIDRAERVKDMNVRYRWDLYWAAGGWRITPENVNDAHIDTALRGIVPEL